MTFFRRRESLNERLAREGGISFGEAGEGQEVRPAWDASGIHGMHRVREWDAIVTVDAPEIKGTRAAFVALDGENLVVEEGPDDVQSLADALEQELQPPYRAEAVRRDTGLWAVAGRRIELLELPGIRADEVELTATSDEHSLVIDGERAFGSIPLLERPGQVVRARRIDGEIWEVEAAPL